MTPPPRRTDIFCKVVDNFGDAGISWRLARGLCATHGLEVTLWLDQIAALARLVPQVAADAPCQRVHGVTIRHWVDPFSAPDPADIVVEAFGCVLPDAYVDAMAAMPRPPAWFVLEYLSAEDWIEGVHNLESRHPRLPLTRRFWFPGFTAKSGGLLREPGLFARRDAYRADDAAKAAFWAMLGVPPRGAGETRISLFCYPNPALPALLDALASGNERTVCVVPQGVAAEVLEGWAGGAPPRPGGPALTRGNLHLHAMPFVDQDGYDRLLWDCDVNFVRGEDSIVRAQWAARPFVWQIYPQADGVHLEKLAALLDRYCVGLDPTSAEAVRRLSASWNGAPGAGPLAATWPEFSAARPHLLVHGNAWANGLACLPDLASALVKAAENGV